MKNKLLPIMLLLVGLNAFSQPAGKSFGTIWPIVGPTSDTFKINGAIDKIHRGFIFISYATVDGKFKTDSSKIDNGGFSFTGNLPYPDVVYIKTNNSAVYDPKSSTLIFVEPGDKTNEVILTDDPFSAIDKSSKTDSEYRIWKQSDDDLKKAFYSVLNNPLAKDDIVRQKRFEDSMSYYNDAKHQAEYTFIKNHPASYVVPSLLITHYRYYTAEQLKAIYDEMPPEVKATKNGQRLLKNIGSVQGISEGAQATNIIGQDYVMNADFDLSKLSGKFVMIDFWGSWCQPCMQLLPDQAEESKKYKGKNIVFVSVALDKDSNKEKCIEITKRLGMNWTNLWSSQDKKDLSSITSIYNIGIFPTFILIDPHGKIIARKDSESGYYECKKILENLLNTPSQQMMVKGN